jgi:DNA-directed RNA polymerase specialized sigma24 family protein
MTGDAGEPRDRAHAEVRNEGVRSKLIRIAFRKARSLPDSEDLVQSALVQAFDPRRRPWNPAGPASFVAHVGSIINGLARNAARSFHAQREIVDSGLARSEDAADSAPLADEALAEQEGMANLFRMGDELRVQLESSDPVAARVYMAIVEGAEGHADIAARARCSPDEVRYAYDRIVYHARRILERERRSERRRIGDRRPEDAKRVAPGPKDAKKEPVS